MFDRVGEIAVIRVLHDLMMESYICYLQSFYSPIYTGQARVLPK
jgi:hypothetical protein